MILVTNSGTETSEANFREMNPFISFPAILSADVVAPYGMSILQETPAPTASSFYSIAEGAPTLVNGIWQQTWIQTPLDLSDAQTLILSNLAEARYTAQISPVNINGINMNANPASITMLNSAIASLGTSTTATVNFKAQSGWAVMNLAQLQAFSTAINTQIQFCFTNEFNLTQNIMALTTTDEIAAFDITTGWTS
jgi:hypothetical protein